MAGPAGVGVRVRCLHRIERLMSSAGLKARRARRRRPIDAGPRVEHMIAGNVLNRQFEAIGPNLKWTADITYLWTHEGWLFVAVVIDLFSRRIVGWSSNARMTTADLVMDALMTAIWRRGTPRALMHHSDPGSQGGFIRSSQHLNIGGCNAERKTTIGPLRAR